MNAGAHGSDMGGVLETVSYLVPGDPGLLTTVELDQPLEPGGPAWREAFGYRTSPFSSGAAGLCGSVVTQASLVLTRDPG